MQADRIGRVRDRMLGLIHIAAVLALISAAPRVHATTYYVATTGSDSNDGVTLPFATIQAAANVVNPGDTVIVRDGVYSCAAGAPNYVATGLPNYMIDVERSGTSSAWITFQAEHQWGAKFDGQNNRCFEAVIFGTSGDNGSFVRFDGFEVYGFIAGFGLYNRSPGVHDVDIRNNHIHDLARYCTTSPDGMGVAVGGSQFYNATIENNLIHDNGRYPPGQGGCTSATTAHYQNNDHGIYVSSYNNLVIKNNIMYNHLAGWAIQLGPAGGSNALIANNTFAFKNSYVDGHIVLEEVETGTIFANNVFYQPGAYAISFYDASATNVTMENNVTDAPNMTLGAWSKGATPTYFPAGVAQLNNKLSTDPKLVDPTNLDFHLAAGSPAIGAGVNFYQQGITADYAWAARPQTGGFDVGAYVYGVPVIAVAVPVKPTGLKFQ